MFFICAYIQYRIQTHTQTPRFKDLPPISREEEELIAIWRL